MTSMAFSVPHCHILCTEPLLGKLEGARGWKETPVDGKDEGRNLLNRLVELKALYFPNFPILPRTSPPWVSTFPAQILFPFIPSLPPPLFLVSLAKDTLTIRIKLQVISMRSHEIPFVKATLSKDMVPWPCWGSLHFHKSSVNFYP